MKYFTGVETIEELKKQYKINVMALHPDRNHDTEEKFKEMQNEYEILFKKVKNLHKTKEGKMYEKATNEDINEFRNILNVIKDCENCTIDIIGNWIWIYGDTKKYRNDLKALNFKWINNKKAWAFHKDSYKKKSKNNYTLNDLKNMFKTVRVEEVEEQKVINA